MDDTKYQKAGEIKENIADLKKQIEKLNQDKTIYDFSRKEFDIPQSIFDRFKEDSKKHLDGLIESLEEEFSKL